MWEDHDGMLWKIDRQNGKILNVELKNESCFQILSTCCLCRMASHVIETPMEIANGCDFPDTNNNIHSI